MNRNSRAARASSAALLLGVLAVGVAPCLRAAEEKPLPAELPPFGEDRPLPEPRIQQSRLPEGLSVWLVSRPGFPKVTAILAARGGDAADPRGQEGISELLAQTLKEGTTTRSSKVIAEQLQAVGGEITAADTNDAILITVNGLATGADRVIEILADVARNAAFPAAEVEIAKGNALQNLKVRASTPEFVADKAFRAAVYGDHPYRIIAPNEATVTAATPEILKKEYARRLRPERSLLVVVGDLNAAALTKAITKAFAGWKGTGEGAPPTPPPPTAGERKLIVVDRPGSVQSTLIVGRPTLTVTDPDYFPLLVANTIFGGSFGSRLTKNIREDKGYTYSPGSGVSAREKGGLLRVRADVRNEVTGASLLEVFYEMDRLGATQPSEEELRTAKRYQAGLYLLRNQIQDSVARTLATNWINGLPPEALGQFVTKVNAVSADDVHRLGRSVFPSNHQTVVVVGDTSKIAAEVAQFGTVVEMSSSSSQ